LGEFKRAAADVAISRGVVYGQKFISGDQRIGGGDLSYSLLRFVDRLGAFVQNV
jgi:hypothetical protein